jgi:hypothetical protein
MSFLNEYSFVLLKVGIFLHVEENCVMMVKYILIKSFIYDKEVLEHSVFLVSHSVKFNEEYIRHLRMNP